MNRIPLFLLLAWLATNGCTVPADATQTPSPADAASPISQYVVEIYEGQAGSLWFGTMERGAIRFDGSCLDYFPESVNGIGNTITSYAEDASGRLWIGSHTGVARYENGKFTRIGALHGLPVRDPDPYEGSVWADRRGTIWVSLESGVHRFDGRRFVPFDISIDREAIASHAIRSGSASPILEDQNGNVWFAIDGYGVLRFDGESFVRLSKADGLPSNNVTDIVEDSSGGLWFSCIQSFTPRETGDGGLARYDGETFETFSHVDALRGADIYTIFMDSRGTLWVGATGRGVLHYDGRTFTLIPRTNRMDLTYSLGLQSAWEDRNGILWLGFSGGLFRVENGEIIHVSANGPWR